MSSYSLFCFFLIVRRVWPQASITARYSIPAQNAALLISSCLLIADFLWHSSFPCPRKCSVCQGSPEASSTSQPGGARQVVPCTIHPLHALQWAQFHLCYPLPWKKHPASSLQNFPGNDGATNPSLLQHHQSIATQRLR